MNTNHCSGTAEVDEKWIEAGYYSSENPELHLAKQVIFLKIT
jgi:hypothetical protein